MASFATGPHSDGTAADGSGSLGDLTDAHELPDPQNCASMIGCVLEGPSSATRLQPEQAAENAALPKPSTANCVGFCFNAIVESVDQEDPRVARVSVIGTNDQRTTAVVERTSIQPSSHEPAAEGFPVRFACFSRSGGTDGVHFESCVQMAAKE